MTQDLRPHEHLALTVALGMMHRDEPVPANVTSVCVLALGRLAGRVGYDAEEVTYRVYAPGEQMPAGDVKRWGAVDA